MKKRILAVFLSCTMVLAAVGCGASSGGQVQIGADSGNSAQATSEGGDNAGAAEVDAASLDPVTLKMYFHGSNVTDDSKVMEEVNAYLKDKINVTLEPIWGTWGDFDQNAVLALQGGDDIDIYFTCSWSADEYNKFARDGYWVRLDNPENNLIEKYGQDLWNLLPEVLVNGATINGADGYGVYAVPGYKDIATQNCWDVNVDLLEKYGYTLDDIKNTDYYGFEEILKKVKEGEGKDFYPLLVEGAVLERMVDNTIIVTGDSATGNFMSYYLDPTDVSKPGKYGNKLVNKFETEEFKKFVDQTRKYYLEGFIDPAMGNKNQANDTRTNKQLSGEYLIGTQSYSLGYELQASQERGIHVEMVPCTDAYVDTTSSQGAMMAISTASKNPDRAMMFLNLLNTDPTLMTLLNYGVEDIHYTKNGDGTITFTEKRADYQPWTNGVGNVTILPPTDAQGVDFWDGFKSYYGAAKEIPVLGFAYDSSQMESQMGAVANVVDEYMLSLCTGTVDPEEKLPEFLKKLDDNGIKGIIDDANSQLDTFMAAKGQ